MVAGRVPDVFVGRVVDEDPVVGGALLDDHRPRLPGLLIRIPHGPRAGDPRCHSIGCQWAAVQSFGAEFGHFMVTVGARLLGQSPRHGVGEGVSRGVAGH